MSSRCRICLTFDNLHEIFPERERIPTTNIILQATGIQVSEHSEMPKALCMSCIFEIQNAHQLRIKASESDQKLREIYHTFEPEIHQETDIFTREIKLEQGSLIDDNIVIKCEPWRAAELDHIDLFKNEQQLQSASWPINDLSVSLDNTMKKPKGSKRDKIKKEPKPKRTKLLKMEGESLGADVKPQRRERKRKLDSISTYVCVLCGKICNRKSIFEEHMFRHYNSRPYECHHCNKTFNVKKVLWRHMYVHTGNKPYQCDMCSNSYKTLENLKYHKINTHGNEADKKFGCANCGKKFAFNYLLTVHLKRYCPGFSSNVSTQLPG